MRATVRTQLGAVVTTFDALGHPLLAGDFVSPSLLSSIDKGYGMIDVMNNTPVDYVCFGNHEADLKFEKLTKRIDESKFPWINSNMPDFKYEHEQREAVNG